MEYCQATKRSEWAIDMCNHMNGSQNHDAEMKEAKPTKVYPVWLHLYETRKRKLTYSDYTQIRGCLG